jgi:hypothetical protein
LSDHIEGSTTVYDIDNCTVIETTDAFGDLIFPSSFAKKSKVFNFEIK